MADATTALAATDPDTDQRVVICGVSWDQYEALLALFGDDFPGVRMAYLEGTLEIMSPSRKHETIKTMLARIVEIYAVERDLPLNGFGSTTFRKKAKERGRFALYRLTPAGYERRQRSELLPGLDFDLLATLVEQRDQTRAVRAFRDTLRRPDAT